MQYQDFTDDEIIDFIRQGDSDALDFLMEKYKYLVRMKAKTLYLIGGDKEDIIQEGMIGLYKAARDYKSSGASFYTFAELCISRQIYTAIQTNNTKKNQPLNNYISYETSKNEADALSNPEEAVIDRERAKFLEDSLFQVLSVFEKKVAKLYLEDFNYIEIAGYLKKEPKAIDNALQRIRKKLQKIIQTK